MRRADRLFQIVQHFRGGRLVTAQKLGQWLEVSERTIYRDVADLQAQGVPLEGAAGVFGSMGLLSRKSFSGSVVAGSGGGILPRPQSAGGLGPA